MKTILTIEDIFDMPEHDGDAVVITTNGVTKDNGWAVMGKGIAKQANDLFKVSAKLGRLLRQSGNQCYDLGLYAYNGKNIRLITFPTKTHWRYPSTTAIIERSAIELLTLVNNLDCTNVYMPPAGCGNGGLSWYTQVCPILSRWLDDRFIAVLDEEKYGGQLSGIV